MQFTPDREQEIVVAAMPKIYRAVDNFTARCSSNVANIPYDDYVQEASIAFLQYIRKCEKEEDIETFPWYDAMDAMRTLVMKSQPLSCPKSQHRFSEIIHGMPSTMSLDDINASTGISVDGMSKHWVDDKETQMDFDAFMSSQTENTRRIASMRLYGMTHSDIGRQCGVTESAVRKRLSKLNEDYRMFMEDVENEQ